MRRGLALALVVTCVVSAPAVAVAQAPSAGHRPPPLPAAAPAKEPVPEARSYVLVDAGTGNVLAGYNENLKLPPASLTKVITALIAVGYLSPTSKVLGTAVSESAYPNQVGIEKGAAWPLDEVLGSLLVYSANDAAYALAQRIGGSLAGFVPIMNMSAAEMGMSGHPVLRDPAGLDGGEGFEGGNLVSARDIAIAGRDLLEVPLLARIVREESYDFTDPTGTVHDLPSMDYTFLSGYPGAIGEKTGFTDRAGDCLLAAARRQGRTMIVAVMNGYNPTQTAIDLLNQGFATPVADEPTTDRLPPVLLPGPREATERAELEGRAAGPSPITLSAVAIATGGASVGTSAGWESASTHALPPLPRQLAARPLRAASPARADGQARRPAGGLGGVMDTWPAQLLLALSGCAALLALFEIAGASRARQRARRET